MINYWTQREHNYWKAVFPYPKEKQLIVDDPSFWYGETTVTARIAVGIKQHGKINVYIIIKSVDDFAMKLTKYCSKETDVQQLYDELLRIYDNLSEPLTLAQITYLGFVQD